MNSDQFKDRLNLIISREKSRSAFAKKCGVAESLLRNYLDGSSLPGMDKLIAITGTAGVSIDWLTTGEGSMQRDDRGHSHTVEGQDRYGHIPPSDFDRQLMGDLIEWLDEGLVKFDLKIIPVEKRKLLLKLYDIYSEEDEAVTRKDIHRDLKLVIGG